MITFLSKPTHPPFRLFLILFDVYFFVLFFSFFTPSRSQVSALLLIQHDGEMGSLLTNTSDIHSLWVAITHVHTLLPFSIKYTNVEHAAAEDHAWDQSAAINMILLSANQARRKKVFVCRSLSFVSSYWWCMCEPNKRITLIICKYQKIWSRRKSSFFPHF